MNRHVGGEVMEPAWHHAIRCIVVDTIATADGSSHVRIGRLLPEGWVRETYSADMFQPVTATSRNLALLLHAHTTFTKR